MNSGIVSLTSARWLIAETIVVVLGILIALGVDDCRTARADRRLEIEHVLRIQDDVERDLQFISETGLTRLQTKRAALEAIAPVVRGQAPVPDDVFAYLDNVSLGGVMGKASTLWLTDTTFQDLRSTGNLRLIHDPAVRAEIAQYYERVKAELLRVRNRSTGYVMFVHSIMPAELRGDLNPAALDRFGVEIAVQRTLSEEFRRLLNQEYNFLLFVESRQFEAWGREFLQSLESYRADLEAG